uniref:ATP synthase F0 subunit 8 n=1 Tax=Ctenolepisma longicaudatum TaxID=27554 RepID=UPI0024348AA8|nr:ATP synthase F0 subunit 8 [Ctenolepisma longicaudatum]WEX31823.1 ATP synthase F0 subunit 8 [Ctenolepisma longicaudatum]
MPQMSPLNWFILFIFFTLIYLVYASFMYFNMTPSYSKSMTTKSEFPTLNWKW